LRGLGVAGADAGFGVPLAGLGELLGQRADGLGGVLFFADCGGGGLAGVGGGLPGLGEGRLAEFAFALGAARLILAGLLPGAPVLLGAVPRGTLAVRADSCRLLLW
jgi:hypothetical protein